MGDAFVNSPLVKAVAWTISALIIAVNAWLTYLAAAENLSESPLSIAGLCAGVAAYLAFIIYLAIGPETVAAWTSKQSNDEHPPASLKAEGANGSEHYADAETSRLRG